MNKDLDFGRVYILLDIIHKTVELPEFKFIKDAAVEELRTMRPKDVAAMKSDAEDPPPANPQFDPSGKPIERTPAAIPSDRRL